MCILVEVWIEANSATASCLQNQQTDLTHSSAKYMLSNHQLQHWCMTAIMPLVLLGIKCPLNDCVCMPVMAACSIFHIHRESKKQDQTLVHIFAKY